MDQSPEEKQSVWSIPQKYETFFCFAIAVGGIFILVTACLNGFSLLQASVSVKILFQNSIKIIIKETGKEIIGWIVIVWVIIQIRESVMMTIEKFRKRIREKSREEGRKEGREDTVKHICAQINALKDDKLDKQTKQTVLEVIRSSSQKQTNSD